MEPRCACLGMENLAFSDVEVFLVVFTSLDQCSCYDSALYIAPVFPMAGW